MLAKELTSAVKSAAIEAGFHRVGIAPAGLVEGAQGFLQWIESGCHGEMGYLCENLAMRMRPDLLVPGAKSVICLTVSYAPDGAAAAGAADTGGGDALRVMPKVARYARGRDYHRILKKRCIDLMDRLREIEPSFDGRAFVDSGPVMERSLAASSGVGFIGRNGALIVPGLGSYVLLCEIVCNLRLTTDAPSMENCRECGRCAAACPTGALGKGGRVDARRCISYHTIENRGDVPPEFWPGAGEWIVGCDACQECCPYNQHAPAGDAELTARNEALAGADLAAILGWSEADWHAATAGSAARRTTHHMFLRNAVIAAGNSRSPTLREPLLRLRVQTPDATGTRHLIDWALDRIQQA